MKDFFQKHSYMIVTIVAILILLGFSYQVMAYLMGLRAEPELQSPPKVVRKVVARPAAYETITSPVIADGRVVSTQEIVVTTEVRGKILAGDVPFKKGQSFRKGDVLLRIFDKDTEFTLRSSKSSFLERIADILPDLKVDYPESYSNWMAFFQSIDITEDLPDLPLPQSEQEKIFVTSRNILTTYYSIKSAEITLDKYVITAPFDGAFTGVQMEVGAVASPGASLASIIRTDILEVEVPVKANNAIWIKKGDSVKVFNGQNTMSWDGTVIRVSDFVETDTQARSVFVRVRPSEQQPVYAGQYMKAEFSGHPVPDVMKIPRVALFNHNVVFVVRDGKLAKHIVNVHKLNETTALISGVQEGTEIVTQQLINTMEDTMVEIIRETRG